MKGRQMKGAQMKGRNIRGGRMRRWMAFRLAAALMALFWILGCSEAPQTRTPAEDEEMASTFSTMLENEGLAAACEFIQELCEVMEGRACEIYNQHCQVQSDPPNSSDPNTGEPQPDNTIPQGIQVVSFTLIDADANLPISVYDPLADGAAIDLSALPTQNINIRANIIGGTPSFVSFTLTGAENHNQTEKQTPYALKGDSSGDYTPWTPSSGSYTLSAAADTGGQLEITFSIVQNPAANTPGDSASPNPDGSSNNSGDNPSSPSGSNSTQNGNQYIKFPGGRVAISHDGNQHDPDDWGAFAMNFALFWAAGLQDKIVHIDHSDHLGDNSTSQHNQMLTTAAGASKFNIPSSVIFDDQTQLSAAIANFKREAELSSESNPLWYICSGPMEVPWRCINAVEPAKRKYIHVISHSSWNETHADTSQMTHTWNDIKALGVVAHDILDQNGSDGDNDFNTPLSKWTWLRDSSYEPYRWVWSRNSFSNKFDVSDAGMSYWLLSGGPDGGDQRGGWPEAKVLLEGALQ